MDDTERSPCPPSEAFRSTPAPAPDAPARDALFATLVEDCLPALRAYARSLCGAPHLADDCVQDACIRALSAFAGFDTARPFRPWIFRILRNEWLQRLRRDRRLTAMPDDEIAGRLIDTHTPEDAAEGAGLLALIARLPPDMADAIRLVLGLGFSYEEAAAACNCAPGTMKSRVNRARAVLIESLKADGPAPDAPPSVRRRAA
ncbi:MAG: RNA polymerase sigma factor [Alphaproteobacteria bacterium]|nr:RNA polymerase sigma factor [Alphaproteobacteria bacterium]